MRGNFDIKKKRQKNLAIVANEFRFAYSFAGSDL